MAIEDQKKTAFTTLCGTFSSKVMPFCFKKYKNLPKNYSYVISWLDAKKKIEVILMIW